MVFYGAAMSAEVHRATFRAAASKLLQNRPDPIEILEIGAGPRPAFQVEQATYTVLDVSDASVARSQYASRRIVADAEEYRFEPDGYDAVVFWNVLEHVNSPQRALANAASTLKKGGYLVIAGPILRSFKALLTRITPHWFHVIVYREVFKHENAGQPGHSPFPVKHSPSASPEEIRELLFGLGFREVYYDTFPGIQVDWLKKRSKVAYGLYTLFTKATSFVTGGRYASSDTEFILILEAP